MQVQEVIDAAIAELRTIDGFGPGNVFQVAEPIAIVGLDASQPYIEVYYDGTNSFAADGGGNLNRAPMVLGVSSFTSLFTDSVAAQVASAKEALRVAKAIVKKLHMWNPAAGGTSTIPMQQSARIIAEPRPMQSRSVGKGPHQRLKRMDQRYSIFLACGYGAVKNPAI